METIDTNLEIEEILDQLSWTSDRKQHNYRIKSGECPNLEILLLTLSEKFQITINNCMCYYFQSGHEYLSMTSDKEDDNSTLWMLLGSSRDFFLYPKDESKQKKEYILKQGELLLYSNNEVTPYYKYTLPIRRRVKGGTILLKLTCVNTEIETWKFLCKEGSIKEILEMYRSTFWRFDTERKALKEANKIALERIPKEHRLAELSQWATLFVTTGHEIIYNLICHRIQICLNRQNQFS